MSEGTIYLVLCVTMTFEPVGIMIENEREGEEERKEEEVKGREREGGKEQGGRERKREREEGEREKRGEREREELTYSVILHSPYQVI